MKTTINTCKNPKRILIICPTTIPLNSGAGKNAFNTARMLSLLPTSSSEILTFKNNKSLLPEEIIGGVVIRRKPFFGNTPVLRRLSSIFLLPFLVLNLKRYDAVLIYGFTSGLYTSILLSLIHKKVIIYRPTMFGSDDVSTLVSRSKVLSPLRKWFLSKVDFHIAIQPLIHDSYHKLFHTHNKSILLPQGVDTALFSADTDKENTKKKLGLPRNKLILFSTGFLIKRKGFQVVFEALRLLKDRNIEFVLYIAGDYRIKGHNLNLYEALKNEMDELFRFAKKHLEDEVVFLGPLNQEHLSDYLSASDVFLLQSRKEGLPNVLLEAMASRVACVVADIPGLEGFLLEDKINCLITRNECAAKLAEQIFELHRDHSLRENLARNAESIINSKFRADSFVSGILELI